jgi:DNA-binding protein YbaB
MLEDLIVAAYNEAAELADEEKEGLMPSGAGGLF